MNSPAELLPILARAASHGDRVAATAPLGAATYAELLTASERVALALLNGRADLAEQRIAFLVPPGLSWIAILWGVWRAGGIAVPLPMGSTRPELEYVLRDTGASTLLFDGSTAPLVEPIAQAEGILPLGYESIGEARDASSAALPFVDSSRPAMILFTSGTTNRPKGVVTTHANLTAQITTLIEAWEWSADDRIPLFLPLHHVHGIVNVLLCALWAGAHCEILPRFDVDLLWERIASGELTLLMAVPTIYYRLIEAYQQAEPERQQAMRRGCGQIRLMVSGSAALPVVTLESWRQISGHTLLERYGMTEIGMALSNPLHGQRVPGSVGQPLAGVRVQLVDEAGNRIEEEGVAGEVEVQGPSVFQQYWGKPEATREAFRLGWFRTGDVAVVEAGSYRLLGRASVDILKSGGHKLSALEIEEELRQHPAIAEVAVVGAPDAEWGERVAAAVVLRPGQSLALDQLREWSRDRMAAYKLPSRMLVVEALPRNAMGKVLKPAVVKLF